MIAAGQLLLTLTGVPDPLPRGFVLVETLPRTVLGKVQKHLLPKWEPTTT